MAHAHESNTKRIWIVFGLLSAVTIIEVWLGIEKPDFLFKTDLFKMHLLNWIFIILTIVKAYYIMWAFMHLEGEKANLRWSIVAPLISYKVSTFYNISCIFKPRHRFFS